MDIIDNKFGSGLSQTQSDKPGMECGYSLTGTIENIRSNRVMYTSVTDFAETRKKAVADGLESSELAALLIEKFAEGASSEGNQEAIKLADRYCQEIDQNYMENRQLRYRTIVKLDLTEARKS